MGQAENAVLVRPGLETDIRLLPEGGTRFIQALSQGASLETAANLAAQDASGFDLALHLHSLFAIGAVIAITFP